MGFLSVTPNLAVRNVKETVKFYTETLGFEMIMSIPGTVSFDWAWAKVQAGNVVIMFQNVKNIKQEHKELMLRPLKGCGVLRLGYKNIRNIYDKVRKKKGLIAKRMNKTFYGAEQFSMRDNNGYILTITEEQ